MLNKHYFIQIPFIFKNKTSNRVTKNVLLMQEIYLICCKSILACMAK